MIAYELLIPLSHLFVNFRYDLLGEGRSTFPHCHHRHHEMRGRLLVLVLVLLLLQDQDDTNVVTGPDQSPSIRSMVQVINFGRQDAQTPVVDDDVIGPVRI